MSQHCPYLGVQEERSSQQKKKDQLPWKPSSYDGRADKRGRKHRETGGGGRDGGGGVEVNMAVLTSMRAARPAMKARR